MFSYKSTWEKMRNKKLTINNILKRDYNFGMISLQTHDLKINLINEVDIIISDLSSNVLKTLNSNTYDLYNHLDNSFKLLDLVPNSLQQWIDIVNRLTIFKKDRDNLENRYNGVNNIKNICIEGDIHIPNNINETIKKLSTLNGLIDIKINNANHNVREKVHIICILSNSSANKFIIQLNGFKKLFINK